MTARAALRARRSRVGAVLVFLVVFATVWAALTSWTAMYGKCRVHGRGPGRLVDRAARPPFRAQEAAVSGAQTAAGGSALSRHMRIEAPPGPSGWERLAPVLRGLLAVLALVASAVDALVTALLGTAPLAPRLRRAGQVLADEYRAGHAGAVDAEVIDNHDEREVWR